MAFLREGGRGRSPARAYRLASVVAVVYSTLARCTVCCTSPTATGVVLRPEVARYVRRKTLHFFRVTGAFADPFTLRTKAFAHGTCSEVTIRGHVRLYVPSIGGIVHLSRKAGTRSLPRPAPL